MTFKRLRYAGRAAVVLVGLLALPVGAAGPVRQDLGGAWRLHAKGKTDAVAATVPGGVHTDLLAAGRIADPFFGDNAASLGRVDGTEWVYARTFTPTAALLRCRHVLLRCEGLDTVATLTLNGREVGRADNMFRAWEFDVAGLLRPGENELSVAFTPFPWYVKNFIAAAQGKGSNTSYRGISNVRKALYGNGWDFAPQLPSMGIDRPIGLVGYDVARLHGVALDTQVEPGRPATLTLRPELSPDTPPGLRLRVSARLDGREVTAVTGDAAGPVELTIDAPQLWWPNGMGPRPLYELDVDLVDGDGRVLDRVARRVGLRKIELLRPDVPKPAGGGWPATDKPLRLLVNGRPVFARGASWVPSDTFLTRATPEKLRALLADAAGQNMNFVRTWGGGYYEPDAFYDACDELGLMVWHDFKFACNGYPGRNAVFADNVRQEVAEQVARLSAHPSIAVWCGNNEIDAIVHRFGVMSEDDYKLLFTDLIGGGLKALVPHAQYVTGSPDEGDEHNWWVWHIGADFEKYRESHGWMTEFGFQSFPVPATVNAFTVAADRTSVLSPVMKAHQHNGNGRGNEMILDQIARYFGTPKDFESTLWLSQINQAYGLGVGIEHWRGDWPRSRGAFVWQLDDCWPCASWSIVDYYGRWKAAMYTVKAEYAPTLVTGVYDRRTATLPLTIASDDTTPFAAEVTWLATDAAGRTAARGGATVNVPAGPTAVAGPVLRLADVVASAGTRGLLVWVDVRRDGRTLASNLLLTVRPKALPLEDPALKADVAEAAGGFDVRLTSGKPALWAWADLSGDPDARWSDNFVHVAAGRPATVHLTPSKPFDLAAVRKRLVVRSLYDLTEHTPLAVKPTLRPGPNGTIFAGVADATIDGTVTLENNTPPNLGAWQDPDAELAWSLDVPRPGTYAVTAELACPKGTEGSRFEVSCGQGRAVATVPATGFWDAYTPVRVGTVRIDHAGRATLKLRVLSMPGTNVMNLRSVTLAPEGADDH